MSVIVSLFLVLLLIAIAYIGAVAGLYSLFGVVLPYTAFFIFVVGLIWRVVKWARSPVPFRIPTTCGQQYSLSFLKHAKVENPFTTWQVLGRMALEILFFRSLFRNTKADLKDGKLVYGSSKWLWAGSLLFHYSLLIVLTRHMRFFLDPIPSFVTFVSQMDGIFEIGLPVLYITDVTIVAGLTYLFLRRVVIPNIRYISLMNDYFPLFLILSIAITGILMRYFFKVDIEAVKELGMGLATFSPKVPEGIGSLFYIHIFLVSVLFAYFPYSKLTHMAGIFMSPTRNLANNNRAVRHINPWNPVVPVHTYEEWEEEFKDKLESAGYEVSHKG